MKPLFIVFEGVDGAGTTTQCDKLYRRLSSAGHQVVQTREPGGTEAGERIRELVLDPLLHCLEDRTELLLYAASRRQLVSEVINPALESNKPVISDRYTASTVAYQGFGRGLDFDLVQQANALATAGLVPDLTVFLDLDVDLAFERRQQRSSGAEQDRLEQAGLQFQAKVRRGYLELAKGNPEQSALIDASPPLEEVTSHVYEALINRFPLFPFRTATQ